MQTMTLGIKISFQGEPLVEVPVQRCEKCGFTTWYDSVWGKWLIQ